MITSSAFTLTVQHLINSPLAPHIAGFASLNYSLSTPPPLPQFTQFTEPDNPERNVKHPFHLMNVMTGLQYLQQKYGFGGQGNKYILVGHSCGATLSFQIPDGIGIFEPAAILGVEGIYDLKKLRNDFVGLDVYQYFIESAFGKDEEEWKKASPTTQESPGGFVWEEAKVVALAHSDDDELVNSAQRDVMWDVVKRSEKVGRKDMLIELKGKHDEVWKEADPEPQLKVAIEQVLKALMAG